MENRVNELLNFSGVELTISVDVDHDVSTLSQSVLARGGKHDAEATVDTVFQYKVSAGCFCDVSCPVRGAIVNDLDEYFIDACVVSWHVLYSFTDDRFFVVGRDVDDETHRPKVKSGK